MKIYWPKAITTMLFTYAFKSLAETFNVLKVDDNVITPMEKFSYTTTDITLKNRHTWVCQVYVLDQDLKATCL